MYTNNTVILAICGPWHAQPPQMCGHISTNRNVPIEIHWKRPLSKLIIIIIIIMYSPFVAVYSKN